MKKNRPYGYVYLIVDCLSDREYVGQTTQSVKTRFDAHCGKQETDIDKAMHEFGRKNFLVFVLKECLSKAELDKWERWFIFAKGCKAPFGYNLTKGGAGTPGWHHTDKAKEKIRQSKLSDKNPQFGKPHSSEHNKKISTSNKGKLLGRVSPFLGCQHTTEVKQKMSKNQMGEKNSFFGNASPKRRSSFPNLVAEMEAHGDNYPATAKRIGVSYQTFRRRMHGEIDFKDNEKAILADYCQKPKEFLFAREDA